MNKVIQLLFETAGWTLAIGGRLFIAFIIQVTQSHMSTMYYYNEMYMLPFIFGSVLLMFLLIGCGHALIETSKTIFITKRA